MRGGMCVVVRVSSGDVSCKVRHRTAVLRTSDATSLRTAGTVASSVDYRNVTPSECPGKVRLHCTTFGLMLCGMFMTIFRYTLSPVHTVAENCETVAVKCDCRHCLAVFCDSLTATVSLFCDSVDGAL